MTREIQLTKGQVALVDDQDFDWLSGFKWYAHVRTEEGKFYAARSKVVGFGLPQGKYNRRQRRIIVLMHGEIMGDVPLGMTIDHEDRNGLNNQRYNLRFVTHQQNVINSSKVDNAKHIVRVKNVYRVQAMRNGIRLNKCFFYYIDAQKALEDFLCQQS